MNMGDVMMLECGRCWEGGGEYNYGGKRNFCVAETCTAISDPSSSHGPIFKSPSS
jgi:hypothetical protein